MAHILIYNCEEFFLTSPPKQQSKRLQTILKIRKFKSSIVIKAHNHLTHIRSSFKCSQDNFLLFLLLLLKGLKEFPVI